MSALRYQARSIHGILILDKPINMSSQQAVTYVKRLYQAKKAGHTGSLDVLATGLLPICLGEATKFSQYLLDADKTYQVTALLGQRTATFDAEGEVIESRPIDAIDLTLITETLKKFRGDLNQVPPMYSALKHQGKPLYELARQGKEIERMARPISIYSLEVVSWKSPSLELLVHCSKGTYIRTLVDDIGQSLGCGAYVTALRRLKAGPFVAEQMVTLEALNLLFQDEGLSGVDKKLLPLDAGITALPSLSLSAEETVALYQGKKLPSTSNLQPNTLVRLLDHHGHCIGVGEIQNNDVLISKRLLQL